MMDDRTREQRATQAEFYEASARERTLQALACDLSETGPNGAYAQAEHELAEIEAELETLGRRLHELAHCEVCR